MIRFPYDTRIDGWIGQQGQQEVKDMEAREVPPPHGEVDKTQDEDQDSKRDGHSKASKKEERLDLTVVWMLLEYQVDKYEGEFFWILLVLHWRGVQTYVDLEDI